MYALRHRGIEAQVKCQMKANDTPCWTQWTSKQFCALDEHTGHWRDEYGRLSVLRVDKFIVYCVLYTDVLHMQLVCYPLEYLYLVCTVRRTQSLGCTESAPLLVVEKRDSIVFMVLGDTVPCDTIHHTCVFIHSIGW